MEMGQSGEAPVAVLDEDGRSLQTGQMRTESYRRAVMKVKSLLW